MLHVVAESIVTMGGWAHRCAQRQLLDDMEVDRWDVTSQSERASRHWTVGDLWSTAGLLGRRRDFLDVLDLGGCLQKQLSKCHRLFTFQITAELIPTHATVGLALVHR